MYKIPENEYRKNLKKFTEILELEDLLEKQVKNLSLGQKMRCEIAATFIHNPQIVYLDEPKIVILTTHDLKDIEDVCDRIILLDKGQIIYDGEKQKFKDTYGEKTIAEIIIKEKNMNISENLKIDNAEILEEREDKLKIKFSHKETTIMKIIEQISKYGNIEDIHMKEAELEDILKEIYKGVHKC